MDHDGCGGAGMPCEHAGCPWWQGDEPLALVPEVQFDHVIATSGLPVKARMLKASPSRGAAQSSRVVVVNPCAASSPPPNGHS
jgi:hypothetical protein